MTTLSVLLAGLAAALAAGPARCYPAAAPGRSSWRPTAVIWAPVVAVLLVLTVAWAGGASLALGAIGGGAAWGATNLAARERRAKAALTDQARVVEASELLAAELRAGRPPQQAMQGAAELWPVLSPAAGATRVGGDVAGALRTLSTRPGCAQLRRLADGWDVAQSSGAGLGDTLDQVTSAAREAAATQRVVTAELASARATARVVAVLPVGALLMATGVGGDPWGFLLTTAPGLTCLAAGLLLVFLGLSWVERIAAQVRS